MLAQKPPMGWNTWNTFGENISEELIMETADIMVEKGYKDAGYEYIVIDDCWQLDDRDENGELQYDPKKFPNGMKYLSDYIHSKGLKFGMYSCAGVRTCAGYPSSYGHEFTDAKTFAKWGVDFLKYDFCHFLHTGNCKNAYLTMSNALKASGREILFSACNWGWEEPWNWMRSIGAHMYRSTGDIFDNYISMRDIAVSQIDKLRSSAPSCWNDVDMLTVGMYGNGNVGIGEACTDTDYETHFALWCMFSAPLMIGGDIRNMNDLCHKLLTNKDLIAIDQDCEGRNPYVVNRNISEDPEKNKTGDYVFMKMLSDNKYALCFWNTEDKKRDVFARFYDMGFPFSSGVKLKFNEVFGNGEVTYMTDDIKVALEPHACKIITFTVL